MKLRALALTALVAALAVPVARADGDPASDFLLSQDTFFPFQAKVSESEQERLNALIADAKEQGVTVKVALIGTKVDLGAVPSLWRKPETYARFLGQELFFVYKGRLLIVMPNGYGVSRGGKAVKSEQRVVDALPPPGEGGPALAAAAERAVRRLAARSGVQLKASSASSGDDNTTPDRIVIAAIAAVALAALVVAGRLVRSR